MRKWVPLLESKMTGRNLGPQDCAICSAIWRQETGWLPFTVYYRLHQPVLYSSHSKKWASPPPEILLSLWAMTPHSWLVVWILTFIYDYSHFHMVGVRGFSSISFSEVWFLAMIGLILLMLRILTVTAITEFLFCLPALSCCILLSDGST